MLKLAVLRHKARLSAEFTKARIRRGYATVDALRQAVQHEELTDGDEPQKELYRHPRWVRVNTLQTSLREQMETTFASYTKATSIREIQRASASARIYLEDPHIPNLLALPPKVDLGKSEAYVKGALVLQDKASCFPAYLLDVQPDDGDCIDGCAAPGNKTTHLAAMMSERNMHSRRQKVLAYERDKARAVTLEKMVKRASADSVVSIKPGADFLATNPESEEFAHVGAILLDPSCSGSGIVGRDDGVKIHLPTSFVGSGPVATSSKGKKRKRDQISTQACTTVTLHVDDELPEETPVEGQLSERLAALSTFQLRILTHAMRFPKANKITYSTCSIHFEENEGVVFRALASKIARARGWRILTRDCQVYGMKCWHKRGVLETDKMNTDMDVSPLQSEEIRNACIRCEKGTEEGTMGFFVAAFVRNADPQTEATVSIASANGVTVEEMDEEWNGFSDKSETVVEAPVQRRASVAPRSLLKKKRSTHRVRK